MKRYLPQNSARYKAKENRYSRNGLVACVACTHNSSSCSAVTLKEFDLLYIKQQLYFTNDKVKQDAILLSVIWVICLHDWFHDSHLRYFTASTL